MKRILGWAAAGLLAGALSLGAQAPRGADNNKDGKCDVCGRPAEQIGQRRGPGGGQGRGGRMGRGMRNCQCPGCRTQNQNQPPAQAPQQKN